MNNLAAERILRRDILRSRLAFCNPCVGISVSFAMSKDHFKLMPEITTIFEENANFLKFVKIN